MMCRVLKVSRSGYYAWRKRGASDREAEEQRIVKRIRQLPGTRKSSYGSPRITEGITPRRVSEWGKIESLESCEITGL